MVEVSFTAKAEIADWVVQDNVNPKPRSGQQEYLENLINRFI